MSIDDADAIQGMFDLPSERREVSHANWCPEVLVRCICGRERVVTQYTFQIDLNLRRIVLRARAYVPGVTEEAAMKVLTETLATLNEHPSLKIKTIPFYEPNKPPPWGQPGGEDPC